MRSSLLVLLALAIGCRATPSPAPSHGRAPAPASARSPARVREPLTPASALARIRSAYRPGVQRCYQSRLKRDPQARGRVVVTFTVDARGRIAYRRARGVHRTVERCVERAMSAWSFPPARGGAATFRIALALDRG